MGGPSGDQFSMKTQFFPRLLLGKHSDTLRNKNNWVPEQPVTKC